MGETIGFYFRDSDAANKAEVNYIRQKLNEIAASLGYTARWGPTAGKGNAAALLAAIARGEVKVVKVDQENNG